MGHIFWYTIIGFTVATFCWLLYEEIKEPFSFGCFIVLLMYWPLFFPGTAAELIKLYRKPQ